MANESRAIEVPAKVSTKAARRTRKLARAAERRASQDYFIPMDAMVAITTLPAKYVDSIREQCPFDVDEHGKAIMVPDPKRGLRPNPHRVRGVVAKREAQTAKIDRKRKARNDFAALEPGDKWLHRAAGKPSRTKHS